MIKQLEIAIDNMISALPPRDLINAFKIEVESTYSNAAKDFIPKWNSYTITQKLLLLRYNSNFDLNKDSENTIENWYGNLDTYNQYEIDKLTPDVHFDDLTSEQRIDLLVGYIHND